MSSSWGRHADDLVVGDFPGHLIDALHRECRQLRDLLALRLRRMPGMLPFGREVLYSVSAAPPDDGRLRALLTWACGADEPEWVWCWWEIDVWCWLDGHTARVQNLLPANGGTHIEVRSQQEVESLVAFIGALRSVAQYRVTTEIDSTERKDHESMIRYWDRFTQVLTQNANEPGPLPMATDPAQVTDRT
jgi:hypothetical protein